MSYPGIPVPTGSHCEFREREMSYGTEHQVLCTYRVPGGPRFRACQTVTDEWRRGLLPSELRREVPRMHHLALRDVQEQVRAHNAVILPIPND